MSGHSKWNNIKNKKEKTDAQRAKVFTKVGKEISIAVREGGPDPASNSKLRDLIQRAKTLNVPNDNIERIIKKASGADGVVYEEIVYEGYGPSGVAVIVEAATDNRNRTGGDIRHFFDKYGGNLGQTGCVSYMFEDKGIIIVLRDDKIDEDALMEAALRGGRGWTSPLTRTLLRFPASATISIRSAKLSRLRDTPWNPLRRTVFPHPTLRLSRRMT